MNEIPPNLGGRMQFRREVDFTATEETQGTLAEFVTLFALEADSPDVVRRCDRKRSSKFTDAHPQVGQSGIPKVQLRHQLVFGMRLPGERSRL